MQRERAEAAVGDLLLHLAARSHEDRRGARLVDRHAGAGDLRARSAAQLHELAPWVHDGEHDAGAGLVRLALGGGQYGRGAVVVDDPARPDDGHLRAPHGWVPVALRRAAQIASSAVMSRTLRSGPPKVKFTAPPGTAISPIRRPAGSKTCTPRADDTYSRPAVSTFMPSGKPGATTANRRRSASRRPSATSNATTWCGRSAS